MHAFLIRNEADYTRALATVDALWDAEPGSPEHDTLDVMAELVDRYEAAQRALPPPDPIALLKFKLKELGWSQRHLGRQLGWSAGRVSEILNGKRELTMRMVGELSVVLNLPPGLLVADGRQGSSEALVALSREVVAAAQERAEREGTTAAAVVEACVWDRLEPYGATAAPTDSPS